MVCGWLIGRDFGLWGELLWMCGWFLVSDGLSGNAWEGFAYNQEYMST